jgi:hypothetical protein
MALLRGVPRSGRQSRLAAGCGGGLQKSLISSVPPPLRRRMADRLPLDHPPLPLHDPLQEDETLSEQCHQPRAARGQRPTALGGAAESIGLAGSGRICSLRTDHLGSIQANHGNAHGGRLPYCRFSRPAVWHIDAVGAVHPICLVEFLSRRQPSMTVTAVKRGSHDFD